jgi:outer membrane protein assembly factor BamB
LQADHTPGATAQASDEALLSTPPGVAAGANVRVTPQVSPATPQVSPVTTQVSAATPTKGSAAMATKGPVTTAAKPESSKPTATVAVTGDYPSDAEIAANWPRFRGPDGLGVAKHKNVPTTWDVPGGKGLVWKSPVPLSGNSSPVVWKNRVFVTGGTIDQRQVYCYGTADGKLLWQQTVASQASAAAKLKDLPDEGGAGFASPTPATDGRRVYAIFATGDVAALDFEGKPVWTRSLGVPKSSYGFASSPTLYRGRLLIQLDQGSPKDKLSKLLALDAATGRTVWETPREVPNSWTSPIVVLVGGRPEIITSADPYVIAYDPQNGGEIWRVKCLRQDVGPSPTFCGGTVYAVSQFPQLSAIRADGKGDLTKTNVLWIGEDGLPDTCSPLACEEFVLLLSSDGVLTCYEAKQGEKLWEEEFKDSNFSSSPTFVGKQVYLFSNEGKSWVVEPTREKCLRIAEGNLGEKCVASPAFQDGRVYIRGEKNLFCLGK